MMPGRGRHLVRARLVLPIPGRPSQQYALMIDAGSTGSRIHVYDFAFCSTSNDPKLDAQSLPTLRHEGFFQLQPGLSAYSGRPREAAESLRPLLEEAVKAIPKSDRPCTPIAVKATAGLRLLGAAESQAILLEVSRWLKAEWPFSVVADGVTIMDGRDEGVYAWITINYVRFSSFASTLYPSSHVWPVLAFGSIESKSCHRSIGCRHGFGRGLYPNRL